MSTETSTMLILIGALAATWVALKIDVLLGAGVYAAIAMWVFDAG